ncbi:MAG: hypothetical protein KBH21_00305 [Acetoanaerobium sp.]|nr:hypothetical protein [Acetoanaerobium sp.]
MQQIIFDIETDGLDYTKIHCLSYNVVGTTKVNTLYHYDDIRGLFTREAIFIGHFISGFDLPVLTKLLHISFKDIRYYDTLFISNYLFPKLTRYGLEDFGVMFKIPKVVVKKDEWIGDVHTDEVFKKLMTERCETDVKINANLWAVLMSRLNILYDNDSTKINKVLSYFAFKSRCAYGQQVNPILIDKEAALNLMDNIGNEIDAKNKALVKAMPKIKNYITKKNPSKLLKKDGSYNNAAWRWFLECERQGVDKSVESIQILVSEDEPNPNSHVQIKDWLFGLGWQPDLFKTVRDKVSNTVKEIPQILNDKKELSNSLKVLVKANPEIILLENLMVLKHRYSLIEGIINKVDDNNYIPQSLIGVTSTLRFKHGDIVNLPSVLRPYGADIRRLLIAPKGKVIIGCDVKNLESRTRDHCIQPIDPEYVEEMSQEGYDSHLDIAVIAGLLTKEQAEQHKSGEQDYTKERQIAKQLNFAAVYNVGAKTLAKNTGKTIKECERLLQGYWERNWAVKKFTDTLKVKECLGSKWVQSEVTGMWLELRSDNDKFSAHNQNLGVTFFDTWVALCMSMGLIIRLQSHDEIMLYCDEGEQDKVFDILDKAAVLANKRLNTNVEIKVDYKYGVSYADVH